MFEPKAKEAHSQVARTQRKFVLPINNPCPVQDTQNLVLCPPTTIELNSAILTRLTAEHNHQSLTDPLLLRRKIEIEFLRSLLSIIQHLLHSTPLQHPLIPTQSSESALLVQGGNGLARHGSGGEEVLLLLLKHVCNSLSNVKQREQAQNRTYQASTFGNSFSTSGAASLIMKSNLE